MEKNINDSLDHLFKYIHNEIGVQYDSIEKQLGKEHRDFLLASFKILMEKFGHAIDHIKTDFKDEE
jgi:hypothetical protein